MKYFSPFIQINQLTCKMFFLGKYIKVPDEYQTIKVCTCFIRRTIRYLIIHVLCVYYVIIALKINEIFTRRNESVERNDAFSCHFFTVFAS